MIYMLKENYSTNVILSPKAKLQNKLQEQLVTISLT